MTAQKAIKKLLAKAKPAGSIHFSAQLCLSIGHLRMKEYEEVVKALAKVISLCGQNINGLCDALRFVFKDKVKIAEPSEGNSRFFNLSSFEKALKSKKKIEERWPADLLDIVFDFLEFLAGGPQSVGDGAYQHMTYGQA